MASAHCSFRRLPHPCSGRTRSRRPHTCSTGAHVGPVHLRVPLSFSLARNLIMITSGSSAASAIRTQPPLRPTSSLPAPCVASSWVTHSTRRDTSAITPAPNVSSSHDTSISTKHVSLLRRFIRCRNPNRAHRPGLTRSSSNLNLASTDAVRRSPPTAGVHRSQHRCPTLQCHLRPRLHQHLHLPVQRRQHQVPSRHRNRHTA
jgi:hypothetical protein